jgi:hypothetical protein
VAEIRPLERDDLPAVAELVRANIYGWSRDAGTLERLLVDHPWSSDPLPSLVAVDEAGTPIGSIGAQVRRLRLGDRELVGVAVSHLVVAADKRAGAAGVMLVRALLGGDQDVTFTDSGTPEVVRIWRALGGHLDHGRTSDWMLVLSPRRWLVGLARTKLSRTRTIDRRATPVPAFPMASARRAELETGDESPVVGEDVSAARLADELDQLAAGIGLRVAYDRRALEAQFEFLRSLGEQVVCRVVRRGERALGWYAYLLRPLSSRVLCVAAPAVNADAVLGELVADATRRGATVLSGRFEPHLEAAIRERPAVMALAQQPIVHTPDLELLEAVRSGASLLTEFDLIDCGWW